jgi:hypothetical protein
MTGRSIVTKLVTESPAMTIARIYFDRYSHLRNYMYTQKYEIQHDVDKTRRNIL